MPYKKKTEKAPAAAVTAEAPNCSCGNPLYQHCNVGEIFTSNGSDKNTVHRYGRAYDFIFAEQLMRKNRPLKVLEIGIFQGASIHSLAGLPYINRVVGIDNNAANIELRFALNQDNVRIYKGAEYNAYTEDAIALLLKNEGQFDVIIDDGPHTWESQVWFLKNYGALLTDGGVLVCEDIYERHADRLAIMKRELDLYVLDLRLNTNVHGNEIMALKYNDKS